MGHFLVIGQGAIGTGIAALLKLGGHSCSILGRKGPIERGFTFVRKEVPNIIELTPENPKNIDGAIFAVKAFDLQDALEQHLPNLPPGCVVITVCNGAVEGIVSEYASKHPQYQWRLGFCTFGVRLERGEYHLCSDSGRMYWGPLAASTSTEAESNIDKTVEMFEWRKDILDLARRKWLFNVALNSIAALHTLACNGDLLNHRERAKALYSEGYRLGQELWGEWRDSEEDSFEAFIKLIHDTHKNENSMARDVRLGRRTESKFLAGLATDAEKYPLMVEYHQKIEKSKP